MSWSKGSIIFDEIISVLVDKVDDDDSRAAIYRELIPVFEEYDCDTLEECVGSDPVFDIVFKETGSSDDDFTDEDDWGSDDEDT